MLCLNILISGFACIYCIQTLSVFTHFTSTQNSDTLLTARLGRPSLQERADDKQKWQHEMEYWWDVMSSVVWNVAMVMLFILQHRVMASLWWKDLLTDLGIITAQRAIYVLATSVTLQYMMWYIVPVRGEPLWYMDTSRRFVCWLVFAVVHTVLWVLIYGTAAVMDAAEMIGIKQVYYDYLNIDPPLSQKSAPTRRLYAHMRHGGATCLMLILWIHPMMTLTRVIIATTLSLFMVCGFAVQEVDYVYLREQFVRKRITLRLQRSKTIDLIN